MDFMKVLDQTVREIKREVNLKVLKVPEIEQKVLDATSDEPWGPHGSALSEIAQGTKKITECQLIMNALWPRLTDTGPKWRHVYKALAVIEYLVANGSEHAVDDIIEHSHQISPLSGFEYVEPNGKDLGLNVRKKAETILALLSDREKINEVREKAASNRDKFFGLSSTGITYKSSSASYAGSASHHSDSYRGVSGFKEGESFRDSYKNREHYGEEIAPSHGIKDSQAKSRKNSGKDNEENKVKKMENHRARNHDSKPPNTLEHSKPSSVPSEFTNAQTNNAEDDFDDFDPRGSSTTGVSSTNTNQVDLFGSSLVGDLFDAPASMPNNSNNVATPEEDLFADAAFVSASPNAEVGDSHVQGSVDLFPNQPAFPVAYTSNVDLLAEQNSPLPPENQIPNFQPTKTDSFDPFAASVEFKESEPFGAFTSSQAGAVKSEPSNRSISNSFDKVQFSSTTSKPAAKKDTFQVKSGIWADSLSRGLIDLNITAPKTTSLADVGIVGGLSDGSDEKEKGHPASANMGRAMRGASDLGKSGFNASTTLGGNSGFSTLGPHQFGSFK